MVTRGMMQFVRSDDELAYVIAREMAQVLYRMSNSSIIRESEDLGCGLFAGFAFYPQAPLLLFAGLSLVATLLPAPSPAAEAKAMFWRGE